jgi:predicted dehydrogenase
MEKIKWGIIGCGDVTEIKSGPAFNKVSNSTLIAVMRRDGVKAKDYAQRHGVPKWYDNANDLINDEEVNAIYIATPPASHAEYAIKCIDAGKPVYIEKPMALNAAEAKNVADHSLKKNIQMVVAHYRREQPLFKKIKELIDSNEIGDIRHVKMELFKNRLNQS